MVDVPSKEWKAGKPLAAQGLNIKTTHLHKTIPEVTWISLRPCCNPVVELDFLANGKPRGASILSSSGDRTLDDYLIDFLLQWRASGKALSGLKGDQTRRIRLKLLLN